MVEKWSLSFHFSSLYACVNKAHISLEEQKNIDDDEEEAKLHDEDLIKYLISSTWVMRMKCALWCDCLCVHHHRPTSYQWLWRISAFWKCKFQSSSTARLVCDCLARWWCSACGWSVVRNERNEKELTLIKFEYLITLALFYWSCIDLSLFSSSFNVIQPFFPISLLQLLLTSAGSLAWGEMGE